MNNSRMIVPNTLPFLERTGIWLEELRTIRIQIKTRAQVDKDSKMMKQLLKLMSPEQMKGYLKGLKK